MNINEYQKLAETTESKDFDKISERLTVDNIRFLHAILGLASELGELADQLKKHIFYGRPLDKINLSEEAGDLVWYLALVSNVPGMLSLEETLERNIAKLKARYGEKFSEFYAANRNLDSERKILEGGNRGICVR
ncbi:MAG TPA: nucleoside triphosphate pyrophosphohydrolase family protein [Candidatus Paceibacterota bacterium]|jgi:NTP pyrophosphatase (non-canonical NTP hydrolase)|nr:nucleoside triphosphate pyrophosphohydrolase family protein [Candidatus Paceibacterota bacterium]